MNDDIGTLVEPAPVTFTWGAPGWYFLGAGILLVIAAIVLLLYRHYRKNKYRRSALSWLQDREQKLASQPVELIFNAAMLMKRIAISRYGRVKVASLQREEWIRFLNSVCKSARFDESDGAWLQKILYGPDSAVNENEARGFLVKTKKWIKDHRHAL